MNRSELLRSLIAAAFAVSIVLSCSCSSPEVVADFDSDELNGWRVTGELGNEPFSTDQLPADVIGFEGTGVFNTGHDQPVKTGTITSPEFTISKKYINFLITGNTHYNAEKDCNVWVVIDGEVVKYAPATRFLLVELGSRSSVERTREP